MHGILVAEACAVSARASAALHALFARNRTFYLVNQKINNAISLPRKSFTLVHNNNWRRIDRVVSRPAEHEGPLRRPDTVYTQ